MRMTEVSAIFEPTPYNTSRFFGKQSDQDEPADNTGSVAPWLL